MKTAAAVGLIAASVLTIVWYLTVAKQAPLFQMCECASEYTVYHKRVEQNNQTVYQRSYMDAETFLMFLEAYGEDSVRATNFDFTDNQKVDSGDMLECLSGFGEVNEELDLCDVGVEFINSHGWPSQYPGAFFTVVEVTQFDDGTGAFVDCPLNTFKVKIAYLDSTVTFWVHT